MVEIENITELINNISDIVQYIVYGYIYLSLYYWISFKDNKCSQHIVAKSIITNYILVTVYQIICAKFGVIFEIHMKVIVYCVVSAILGLVFGKLISSKIFNTILHQLHIGRTTNENIWDDIIEPYMWLRVYMKDGSSYLGQCRFMETFEREPIITLITYQKLNADGDIVLDYSENGSRTIVLNTKNFEKIEVISQNWNKYENGKQIKNEE